MGTVAEKLHHNRYRVDEDRPHIRLRDPAICRDDCRHHACLTVCPAGAYSVDADGLVRISTDGCLECGSCRIVCAEYDNLDWDWPRGGYGILYKFG